MRTSLIAKETSGLDPAPFLHHIETMYWVYIIMSKNNQSLYIGSTPNLVKRLDDHNAGRSKATSRYKPWFYVYIEGYFSKEDAFHREKTLKQFGKVYSQLKRRIKNSLRSAKKVRG